MTLLFNTYIGDVIAVTGEMDSDGYYNGIFEGRRGLVPAKFLEEMDVKNKEVQQRLLNQVDISVIDEDLWIKVFAL